MQPEKDWAEKAVEEIMQIVYIEPICIEGLWTSPPLYGYSPQFKPYAVEIIERHARIPILTDREPVIQLASPDSLNELAETIASKLAPKEQHIHIRRALGDSDLSKVMRKLAANVRRGEARLKPYTFAGLCRYLVRDCWRLMRRPRIKK